MKIVVIGDFHIPSRAKKIPDWIVGKIIEEKPDMIACTGDLESEDTLSFLHSLAKTKCVSGNMDWLDLPDHQEFEVGDIRIGLIHGKGIVPRGDINQLNRFAEMMRANILIHGHTHKLSTELAYGRLFVNPGTATGVWGGATGGEPQSFIIIEINGKHIIVRKFVDEKEVVERYEYRDGSVRPV